METSTIIGLVALGVVAVALAAAVLIKVVYAVMQGPLTERIAAQYGQAEILMQDLRPTVSGANPRASGSAAATEVWC